MDTIQAYSLMCMIRLFEEAIERLFLEGRASWAPHTPASGKEAVAVGTAAALETRDAMTTTHRGHGHFLARGADPEQRYGRTLRTRNGVLARLRRQPDDDGSFHRLFRRERHHRRQHPLRHRRRADAKLRDTGRVTVCFFGDGASNQGVFHETLNLAALWKLPVLFVVENNGYAMSTPTARGLANPHIADRANAYGITGVSVDGNDFFAARLRGTARGVCRAGQGPVLLECVTTRLSGHSRGDPRVYRSREEEAAAWENDPILRLETRLKADGTLTDATAKTLREKAQACVDDAIRFTAESSPLPDPASLQEDVFA